jgi:predicted RNA binding protein with dsRBD fold (UPF0201 family)
MKKVLSRVTTGTAAAITVAAGLTSVVSAATLNYERPDHHQKPSSFWSNTFDSTTLKNKTLVDVHNINNQKASSGDVKVEVDDEDTSVGNVATGAATNENSFTGTISVNNASSSHAALSSEPQAETLAARHDDENTPTMTHISDVTKTYVSNYTDLNICNVNNQSAYSGDITVEVDDEDSTVGSITTGDATNTNTTSLAFSVTN